MDKIITLINHLKAYYIILIENDLHFETETEKILGKYCGISDYSRTRLTQYLYSIDKKNVSDELNSFFEKFNALEHNLDVMIHLMPDDLREYLKKVQAEEILNDITLKLIADAISDDVDHKLKDALLRFGIFKIEDSRYSKFFQLFEKLPNIHINFYKNMPVPEELDVFESELAQGISDTESVFYLGIIDKKLGSDAGDEQGKSFIEGDLWNINEDKKYNFIGFLYTSDPVQSSPNGFKDYFIREIQKGDDSFEESVVDCLLNCAYVSIFNSLKTERILSTGEAFNIAIKNQNNIKNIIDKAIIEGVSLLDSIKNWFELAIQYKLEEHSLPKVQYNSSLSKLINDSDLIGNEGISNYGKDLQKINSFELFDNNITSKNAPILPGNIFILNNEYYILIGQVCDILLRKNNTRGAKLAEFLKAIRKPYQDGQNNEKFTVNIETNGTKKIIIEHFEEDNEYYSLEAEITSKNMYYSDFEIIDLCSYSDDGVARIDIDENYKSDKYQILHHEKNEYFQILQEKFKEISDLKKQYNYPFELKSQYIADNNIFDEVGTQIDFKIKRISTLKGRFYDSLYQQYLNYRGRIDLNLIENSIFTPTDIDLILKFNIVGQDEICKTKIMMGKGEKNHLLKTELIKNSPEKFLHLINSLDDKILMTTPQKNSRQYSLNEIEGNWILELKVEYTNAQNVVNNVPEDFIKFARLFGTKMTDPTGEFIDNQEKFEIDEDEKIMLTNIVRGIKLNQNKATIIFENGKIIHNVEEQEL